jgi:hypothetical protein
VNNNTHGGRRSDREGEQSLWSRSVVTFNFDDLLEAELGKRKVAVQPVTSSDRQRGDGLRVIHPHGYVPKTGPISRRDIVFTEPDYHRLTEAVFHRGLADIVDRLRKNTVLFIGLPCQTPAFGASLMLAAIAISRLIGRFKSGTKSETTRFCR